MKQFLICFNCYFNCYVTKKLQRSNILLGASKKPEYLLQCVVSMKKSLNIQTTDTKLEIQNTKLGPLESEIVSVIWNETQPAKVSLVLEKLNNQSSGKNYAYTTVMTVLNRLVEKNFLSRQKQGKAYVYSPSRKRDSFLKRLIRTTLLNFSATFGDEALLAFADEAASLSKEKKESLSEALRS